ncbi:Yip1 domain-containing protein [Pilobolus umbonatus]|nr:Yip1 domain-containing protein [Pilobolus umbonatus]
MANTADLSKQNDNPFEESNSFDNSTAALIEPDIHTTETTQSTPLPPPVDINTVNSSYTGEDTLDEPVSVTIMRDLKKVANKSLQVLHPNGDRQVLRDWDLWGPLILCLTLALLLSIRAPETQSVAIFTGVFVIVWLGAAIVTLNAKLLGGTISFFQSVCVIGYCLFPILVSAIVATFVDLFWARLPVAIVTYGWSTYASVGFMSESQVHLDKRRTLAVYPIFLFYFVVTWLVLIS